MRLYNVEITGVMPLLMHADNIEWADRMEAWKNDKDNKQKSRAGDDRTPAFRWIGSLYRNDAGLVTIPTENIMRSLMEGGAMVLVPSGKSGKTFKAQSQSGVIPREPHWPLLVDGKPVATDRIDALLGETDFAAHEATVQSLGFSLFVKRARIGTAKHIRVRPRFDRWSVKGELAVVDDQITDQVLADILDMAGKYKGLGDWRPSSKTPGTFGMFSAEIKRIG